MKTEEVKWYQKYPRLSSSQFTWELCGIHLGEMPPFSQDPHTHEIEPISSEWRVIGYCLNLSIRPRKLMLGLMFENTQTFEKMWFHYLS